MRKVRITFDAAPMMDIHKTGVGYYVDHLVRALANDDNLSLSGYFFDFFGRNHKVPPVLRGVSFRVIRVIPGKFVSILRKFGFQPPLEMFVRDSSDINLFTNYVSLPSTRRTKSAVVIYDLSFVDYPEYVEERNLAFLRKFCPPSLLSADVIITISDFTKQRILEEFPNIRGQVVVTPIPPMPLTNSQDPAILERLSLTKRSYLLYLGTIEPRKNIVNLLYAYRLLPKNLRDSHPLVLVGGKGWKDQQISALIEQCRSEGHQIITPGYVTDAEKFSLYQSAACFVLPSHYEGFGMPILEAMQHSIPVAVSDIPVFREVAGEGAVYFDKDDPSRIAEVISDLLTDNNQRSRIIKAQSTELQKYSWSTNAELVSNAIQSAVGEVAHT